MQLFVICMFLTSKVKFICLCYSPAFMLEDERNKQFHIRERKRMQERMVDALALGGDEGRGKLR